MNIVNMDGLKRKGKLLMGSSDLSFVIYEQKCLHESQAKVLPNQTKVSTALLKWSYTESNANIPNLYSCWSDLDYALQMLTQESIDHSVEYRKVFKEINAEGKKVSDIQKEKEASAKKVTAIKKQIESARKSKKGADKVKLGNLEAELTLAQGKDIEMGKLVITKTKEFEEYKSTVLRDSSVTFCDRTLETLDRMRQVCEAKREVASAMTPSPVYSGDRISQEGMKTVDSVFQSLQMEMPVREPALDRMRCFGLGTRSSSISISNSAPAVNSPKLTRTLPKSSPPSIPSNHTPSMKPGHTGTMGSNSSNSVYQGGDELDIGNSSDDEHDYQVPTEEIIGKKSNSSMENIEEEYLAPVLIEHPVSPGPRVPPRLESKQNSIDSMGTSKTPGDYMVVVNDLNDTEEARMPPGTSNHHHHHPPPHPARSSTDSGTSVGSVGAMPGAVKLPLPKSKSIDSGGDPDGGGADFCLREARPKHHPGAGGGGGGGGRSPDMGHREKTTIDALKEKQEAMLKRKPVPLPKPDVKPKPMPKPKPGKSPNGMLARVPRPRTSSSDQDPVSPGEEDAGGFYEIMSAADAQKIQMNNSVVSTYEPEEEPDRRGVYSEVYERDDDDSDGDYCVAGQFVRKLSQDSQKDNDGYFPLLVDNMRNSSRKPVKLPQLSQRRPSNGGFVSPAEEFDEAPFLPPPPIPATQQ